MTEILIKRLSKNVALPRYETEDSSGLDLAANIDEQIKILPGKSEIIPTGLAVAIPKNFEIHDLEISSTNNQSQANYGDSSFNYLIKAIEIVKQYRNSALVTGPICRNHGH